VKSEKKNKTQFIDPFGTMVVLCPESPLSGINIFLLFIITGQLYTCESFVRGLYGCGIYWEYSNSLLKVVPVNVFSLSRLYYFCNKAPHSVMLIHYYVIHPRV
jgi:hypothetical protein